MTRSTTISNEGLRTGPEGTDSGLRELIAIREIVHAFLTADRPEEVFQFALDRVSPLVGANFACVYLVDGASELMRLAAVHNWPERFTPFLGEMRVRLGFGPSGEAAAERRVIEVPDVFADSSLEDWAEVAHELGFRAIVALPLQTGDGVLGAVAFYFEEAGAISAETRSLLRMVADQMAATAQKARLIEDLRRANAALLETNAELERQYVALLDARRVKDEFLQTTLKRGGLEITPAAFDVRDPMHDAIAATRGRPDAVALRVTEPESPALMVSDRRKITKLLVALLSNAYKFTPSGEVRLTAEARNGRAVYRVEDTGIGIPEPLQQMVFDEFRQVDGSSTRRYGGSGLGLSLARRLAHLLGGEISLESSPGQGSTFRVELPLDYREAVRD